MYQNSVIAIAVVAISFFSFVYISMQEIFKFRLKKEQIKAETLIKTEEIKAKNQLEIEALIRKDSTFSSSKLENNEISFDESDYLEKRNTRKNERV